MKVQHRLVPNRKSVKALDRFGDVDYNSWSGEHRGSSDVTVRELASTANKVSQLSFLFIVSVY